MIKAQITNQPTKKCEKISSSIFYSLLSYLTLRSQRETGKGKRSDQNLLETSMDRHYTITKILFFIRRTPCTPFMIIYRHYYCQYEAAYTIYNKCIDPDSRIK